MVSTPTMARFGKTCLIFAFILGLQEAQRPVYAACPQNCVCTPNDPGMTIVCTDYPGSTIPEGLGADVLGLTISGSNISAIRRRDFENATSLRTLILSRSPLASIENGSFDQVIKLTLLSLHDTALPEIPDGLFSKLALLNELLLPNNLISKVTAQTFTGLDSLQTELDLSGNAISELSGAVFSNLNKLDKLNLKNNVIPSLPGLVFTGLTNANSLLLGNNRIAVIDANAFVSMTWLTHLDLSYNNISTLPRDLLTANTKLLTLDLSYNLFSTFPNDTLTSSVETFRFNGNLISTLPALSLHRSTALKEVSMCSNENLGTIETSAFGGLDSLQTLSVCNNTMLTTFPAAVLPNPVALETLDISFNSITSFEQNLFVRSSNLKTALIHGNSLFCNCNAVWIREAMDDTITYPWANLWVAGPAAVYCDSPATLSLEPLSQIPSTELTCDPPKILTVHTYVSASETTFAVMLHGGAPQTMWMLPSGQYIVPLSSVNTRSADIYRATETHFANWSVLASLQITLISNVSGNYTMAASNAGGSLGYVFPLGNPRPSYTPPPAAIAVVLSIIFVGAVLGGFGLAFYIFKRRRGERYQRMGGASEEGQTEAAPSVQTTPPIPVERARIARGQRSYGGLERVTEEIETSTERVTTGSVDKNNVLMTK